MPWQALVDAECHRRFNFLYTSGLMQASLAGRQSLQLLLIILASIRYGYYMSLGIALFFYVAFVRAMRIFRPV